jgi:hypothetical protein
VRAGIFGSWIQSGFAKAKPLLFLNNLKLSLYPDKIIIKKYNLCGIINIYF